MSKLLWRCFVVILLVTAFIPSVAVIKQSFIPIIIISAISILFLILELPSKGIAITLQKRAIKIIFSAVIFFCAFILFKNGMLEFTNPVMPRSFLFRTLVGILRDFLGAPLTATLFFSLAALCTIVGFTYMRTGKIPFFNRKVSEIENVKP